jgi:uncharacterized membrane protein YvbJ
MILEMTALIAITLSLIVVVGVLAYYIKSTNELFKHLVKAVKSRDLHEMLTAESIAEELEKSDEESINVGATPLEDLSDTEFMEKIRDINREKYLQDNEDEVESG